MQPPNDSLQNIKLVTCRLLLAPQQLGVLQIVLQSPSPFLFDALFGKWHMDHEELVHLLFSPLTVYENNDNLRVGHCNFPGQISLPLALSCLVCAWQFAGRRLRN